MNHLRPLPTLAAAVITLASCSDGSYTDSPQTDSGAIRFTASADYASRAGDITTNNLTSFNVYAYTDSADLTTPFMDNVTVSKTGTNTWTYSPVKYWPANHTVDFYAFAPGDWIGSSNPLRPISYTGDITADQDIVYAVTTGLSGNKYTSSAQVVFNFRHALSKVALRLSSSNADLRVMVSNVALANIKSTGNFTLPSESTTGTPRPTTTGHWSDQATPIPIIYHMSQTLDDIFQLTTTPTDMSTTGMGLGGGKYLMPQELVWLGNGSDPGDTYITVMCSVYDADTGDKLWPNEKTPAEDIPDGHITGDGLLKFPLSTSIITAWQPGFYYIYNLVINANDEMSPIQFGTPNVETYVDVTTNYQ